LILISVAPSSYFAYRYIPAQRSPTAFLFHDVLQDGKKVNIRIQGTQKCGITFDNSRGVKYENYCLENEAGDRASLMNEVNEAADRKLLESTGCSGRSQASWWC
jgi:hypothetical protein